MFCVCMMPTKISYDEDNRFTGTVSPKHFQSQPHLKGHHDLSFSNISGIVQNSYFLCLLYFCDYNPKQELQSHVWDLVSMTATIIQQIKLKKKKIKVVRNKLHKH